MKKNLVILLMLGFTAMGAQAADRSLGLAADVRPTVGETQSAESSSTSTVEEKKEVYFDIVEVETQEVDSKADGDILNI